MAKYRKKPVIIEAEAYQKGMEDGFDCTNWVCIYESQDPCPACKYHMPYIVTLEGKYYISPDDYIITGVMGERYPCKPHIFLMTYEPVEETDSEWEKSKNIRMDRIIDATAEEVKGGK